VNILFLLQRQDRAFVTVTSRLMLLDKLSLLNVRFISNTPNQLCRQRGKCFKTVGTHKGHCVVGIMYSDKQEFNVTYT